MIWTQASEWHITTEGYTVCRYRFFGMMRFEAWRHRKRGEPTMIATNLDSAEEAKRRCELDKSA